MNPNRAYLKPRQFFFFLLLFFFFLPTNWTAIQFSESSNADGGGTNFFDGMARSFPMTI
ncbi:hypothetical protein LINPERPRIM_LOCUS20549 [Linum perenne]